MRGGRQVEQHAFVVPQHEVPIGIGQGDPRERLRRVGDFRCGGPQEFAANRRIEKQIANFDRRTLAAPARLDRTQGAAVDFELGAGERLGGTARDPKSAHLGDRSQRFAAEAERADMEQVVGVADFAGRVAGDRQRQLFRANAAPIVGDADQFATRLAERHFDAAGAGVDRVLDELFDDAGWPFDDFASGDLVDHSGR